MAAERNNTLDLLRIVAFCGVVALHTVSPDGPLSAGLNIASRFGVPFFFAVAGFFSLRAGRAKLRRRLAHVARIALAAVALYAVTAMVGLTPSFEACCGGADYPMLGSVLWNFFVWNAYPPAYPLWFLFALLYVYFVWMLLCERPGGMRLFCVCGACLLAARVAVGEIGGFIAPLSDPMRSWLLTGIPSFALGLLLRQHQDKLASWSTGFDALMVTAGAVCAVMEAATFGLQELYVGTVIVVTGVFAAALRHPCAADARGWFAALRCGETSMIAYVVHYAVIMLLMRWQASTEMIRFLATCSASLLVGFVIAANAGALRRRRA